MNINVFEAQWWVMASRGSKKTLSILAISGLLLMSGLPTVAMAAVSFGSATSAANESNPGNVDDLTIDKPSATVEGDFLIAGIAINGGDEVDITEIPSGWTLIERTDNDDDVMLATYYKFAGSSEPASYTWEFERDSSDVRAAGGIVRYTGVHLTNPIDEEDEGEGFDDIFVAPSVTTDFDNDLVVVFYAQDNDNDHPIPSGTSERYDVENPNNSGPRTSAADFTQASAGATGTKSIDSGNSNEDWVTQTVALRMAPTGSISGYKLDHNEEGVSGWTIWLYDYDEWYSTETDGDGYYEFVGAENGDYTVCEEVADGWVQAYPEDGEESGNCDGTNGYDITVADGEDFEDVNFVNYELGTITITKDTTPEEVDQNFDFTTSGEGLEDFTLNTAEDYTQTFYNLVQGEYSVTEALVDGYVLTDLSCDGGDVNVNVETGEVAVDLEYGDDVSCTYVNERLPNLTLVKYAAPGEEPFEISVEGDEFSTSWFANVIEDGTDTSSNQFYNMAPGEYDLSEVLPEGWGVSSVSCYLNGDEDSWSNEGTAGVSTDVELGYGDNATCIFNNTEYSIFVGDKFEDLDGNGEGTDGDGIEDWYIALYKWYEDGEDDGGWWNYQDGTYTDIGGVFSFGELLPGTYLICEGEGDGEWHQSYPTWDTTYAAECEGGVGYEFTIADIPNPGAGETYDGFRFGNYERGSIAGVKWYDTNADGVRDESEEGIDGWTIYASGFDYGNDTSTVGGSYAFGDLDPGTYTISEEHPEGWAQSYPTGDGTHTVVVTSGQNVLDVDFGNVEDSTISGEKWNDENGNGAWDDEEGAPEDSFVFRLYRVVGEDEPVLVDSYESNWGYSFYGLLPGTYLVLEDDMEGWMQTYPADFGGHTVTVGVNEDAEGYDFGNVEVINLFGYKFYDVDRDGEWYYEGDEDMEPGLAGWTIFATPITGEGGDEDTESGRVEKSTVTEEGGEYDFEFLGSESGWWRIGEEMQSGWSQTYPGGEVEFDDEDPYYYDVYIETDEGDYYDYDFGNWRWPVIEIFKWNDVNRDGVRNEIAGTEDLESPTADYPVAVARKTGQSEGEGGHDIIETEIVALSLTGSNGVASIPLNPDWFGGFEGLDQALHQGLMALEGQVSGWEKTYPTQTHNDQVNVSYREGLEQTPVFIDSFFDIFTEFADENPVMNQGWVHDQESGPTLLAFGNNPFLVMSEQLVLSFGEASAVIRWMTDRPATSRVVYDIVPHPVLGDAPNYGYAYSTNTLNTDPKVLEHKVELTGLTPNATYYYRTVSSASPETVGSEGSFTTNPIGGPVVAGVGSGGGGLFGSFGVVQGQGGGGQVLGAATFTPLAGKQCITTFLGANRSNDPAQVKILQTILGSEGFSAAVNGVFDSATVEGVKGFQTKYAADILAPWGITKPTGIVYLTTKNKLNALYCGSTSGLSNDEQSIIDRYRGGASGGTAPVSTAGEPAQVTEPATFSGDEEAVTIDESQAGAAAEATESSASNFWKKLRTFLRF